MWHKYSKCLSSVKHKACAQLLKAKKLFLVLVVLRFENGPERLRFELTSIGGTNSGP